MSASSDTGRRRPEELKLGETHFAPTVVQRAPGRGRSSRVLLAMKLAVVGKGGAGKTVLVTLLARVLSERGHMVLAVDLDANPGLAVSLGVVANDRPLPPEAVEERAGTPYGWALARHLTPAEAVRRYGIHVGDRVVFLGYGNRAALDSEVTRFIWAVLQVAKGFNDPGWVVVADVAAGPTNPFEGYVRFASLAVVAVEPTQASIVTAKGLLPILEHGGTRAEVVVTKARCKEHVELVARELPVFASVPFDPEIWRLERRGSLVDLPSDSAALEATRDLASKLDQ